MKNIRPTRALEKRGGISPLALTLHVLVVFICFVGILLINYWPDQIDLREGEVSPRAIMADKRVEILNEQATEDARRRAAAIVPERYTFNSDAINLGSTKIEETFVAVDKAASAKKPDKPLDAKVVKELKLKLPLNLSEESLRTLLELGADERFSLQNGALHIFYKLMDDSITEARLDEVRAQTDKLVEEQMAASADDTRQALVQLINDAVQVNQIPSFEKTQKAKREAMAAVQPVMTIIPKGAAVVREGEMVTGDQIKILEELGLYKPRLDANRILGVCLMVMLCLGVLYGYLFRYRQDFTSNPRYLYVLGVIMVAVAAICRLLMEYSGFLTPVAIASVLVTTLMDRRLGLLVTGVQALLIGVMAGSLAVCGVGFLTGAVGVLALSRVDSRNQMIRATLLVGFSNFVAVVAFQLVDGANVQDVMEAAGFGLLNGLLSGWVAVGSLPMFEHFSGITTHFRLLDLSNMNEPLLRRLTLEAPGTYQHSMMVANLSEQAARAVGADPLLCRVGAYYHDIGKMKRPRFFIENQMGLENPHDKLAPSLSTRIIHSHVKDGVEMAKEEGLPDVLIDFIQQHHGTSLVGYFYHQACARSSEPVFEEDFRYPGPRPQTKETAILMLCDGLEAAARTLSQPTPEKLSELVEKMVKHNMDDGQLNESGLSLKDIQIIKQTLSKALQNIYHARIEYPDAGPERKKVTQLRSSQKKSS
ncbi:MAG: HDIG domain-containing protein [Candidatus Eremiobacteraeota bacterium]|nr:HDIG domain-containing protein [Candidatus Eremiobacteraeota bacterium]